MKRGLILLLSLIILATGVYAQTGGQDVPTLTSQPPTNAQAAPAIPAEASMVIYTNEALSGYYTFKIGDCTMPANEVITNVKINDKSESTYQSSKAKDACCKFWISQGQSDNAVCPGSAPPQIEPPITRTPGLWERFTNWFTEWISNTKLGKAFGWYQ